MYTRSEKTSKMNWKMDINALNSVCKVVSKF